MANLGRLWAGHLFGTNTGNLAAELNSDGNRITGVIRFRDTDLGLVVYSVTGTFEDGVLAFEGATEQRVEGLAFGNINARATLSDQGALIGQWSSTIGSGGTFQLFPHDPPAGAKQGAQAAVPEQVHVVTKYLGAVRIYGKEIEDVIGNVRSDFNASARVIVTYTPRGSKTSKYAEDFLASRGPNERLTYISIYIQEPDAHGVLRNALVELDANASNMIRVQSVNESWATGKAEMLAKQLKPFEKWSITNYRKYGLGVNQVLFLTMLILLPEIRVLNIRAAFVVGVVTIAFLLLQAHKRLIPSVVIYGTAKHAGGLVRAWPSILSWIIAMTASLVAALILLWITRNEPEEVADAKPPQAQQRQQPPQDTPPPDTAAKPTTK